MSSALVKHGKTILSSSSDDARRRVRSLYKAWIREVPHAVHHFELDISQKMARDKVKELFMKNAHVRDPRVIDMLLIKGKLELDETVNVWKQKTHLMRYWPELSYDDPRKKDWLTRFYEGHD
eukprot:Colp12_sorted_trinity150504_noHs@4701